MKKIHIIVLLMSMWVFACQTDNKSSSIEQLSEASLKGKWEAVSMVMNGEEMLGEAVSYSAYEFKEYGQMTTYTDDKTLDMTYRFQDDKMQIFGDNGSLNVDIARLTHDELVLNYDTGKYEVTAKFKR